jgi:hypothetical protein
VITILRDIKYQTTARLWLVPREGRLGDYDLQGPLQSIHGLQQCLDAECVPCTLQLDLRRAGRFYPREQDPRPASAVQGESPVPGLPLGGSATALPLRIPEGRVSAYQGLIKEGHG